MLSSETSVGLACTSRIEELPPELRTQIILCIPDVATLNSLIRASKRYYSTFTESPDYYLQAVLSSQIPPRCLRYAYAQILAEEASSPLRINYKRTMDFLRQYCGVHNPSQGNATGRNEHLDDAWNVQIDHLTAKKIFLNHKAVERFANAYCVKTFNGLNHDKDETQKIDSQDTMNASTSEMHRIYRALINLFYTLFAQLRTERKDSTRDMIEYYDSHIADSFNSELISQMKPDTIHDREYEDIQTEKETLEGEWPKREWHRPQVSLLSSLTLWERQEVYVLFKYILEEVNLAWIAWSTWRDGTPPLEELNDFDLDTSHKFTLHSHIVDSYTFQLITLGLRRLSQFLFDLKTPQQRNFMYAYRRVVARDEFEVAFEICCRYDRGEPYQRPITHFPQEGWPKQMVIIWSFPMQIGFSTMMSIQICVYGMMIGWKNWGIIFVRRRNN